MTLFFNLSKLEKATKSDPIYIVEALKMHYNSNRLLNSRKSKYKAVPDLGGRSFILNPHALFSSNADILFKVQYIRLAALRNYLDVRLSNIRYLDLSMYPEINLNIISSNPLLSIKNNKIYFEFEET